MTPSKRRKPQTDEPIVTHVDGKLTRKGAMIEARKKYGDLGTVAEHNILGFNLYTVWCIGQHGQTAGRGRSWEQALSRTRPMREEKSHEAQPNG